ncbi:DNA polymerase eta-like [Oratosquilla oratoria]|uniref:DNA polymerase eta-like n=1 Tax=Oratosquilla oratoria TaxID=337810 RepID=UPI003F75CCDA
MTERIVVLLDMDCFYVQVEERDNPHIRGVPAAVVQYNSWKGGGIIAVNYEARAFGVKRGMRGDEARAKCPEIQLVQVPVNRGKADLTKYRNAGREVITVLCEYSDCVERASIDEAYIDMTSAVLERIAKMDEYLIDKSIFKSTWISGFDNLEGSEEENKEDIRRQGVIDWLRALYQDEQCSIECGTYLKDITSDHPSWDDFRLAVAAATFEEVRAEIFARTGFKCSAGIAHNKMLGKLSCGIHKPNQQTVMPQSQVPQLWKGLHVSKIRNLGGKLGDSLVEHMGCTTMADLAKLTFRELQGMYDDKTSRWLYNLGKGIDHDTVVSRQLPKSIGCGKNFQGKEALTTKEKVSKWMRSLADELQERLEADQNANKRKAKTITVSIRQDGDEKYVSLSRSCPLPSYSAEKISLLGISLINHTNEASPKDSAWKPSIKHIGLSAGKFEDCLSFSCNNIQDMFKKIAQVSKPESGSTDTIVNSDKKGDTKSKEVWRRINKTSQLEKMFEKQRIMETSTQKLSEHHEERNLEVKTSVSPVSTLPQGTAKPTNSFFKNFMLRKNIDAGSAEKENSHDLSKKEDCTVTNTCEVVSDVEVVSESSDTEVDNEENGNKSGDDWDVDENEESQLDALVDELNREESEGNINKIEEATTRGEEEKEFVIESGSESGDDWMYEASTDVDSSYRSQECAEANVSPDMFGSCGSDSSSAKERGSKVSGNTSDEVGDKELVNAENSTVRDSDSNDDEKVETFIADVGIPQKENGEKSDCAKPMEKCRIEKESHDRVTVGELFPNIDEIDESVLPLLPIQMRKEIEKAMMLHRAKIEGRKAIKKDGIWKYVVESPPKNEISRTINSPQSEKKLQMSTDDCQSKNVDLASIAKKTAINALQAVGTEEPTTSSHRNTEGLVCKSDIDVHNAEKSVGHSEEQIIERSEEDMFTCDQCNEKVWAFEFAEHLDFHVAEKLQKDFRNEGTERCNRIGENGSNSNLSYRQPGKVVFGKKRGRPNKRGGADKRMKKLDIFLVKR